MVRYDELTLFEKKKRKRKPKRRNYYRGFHQNKDGSGYFNVLADSSKSAKKQIAQYYPTYKKRIGTVKRINTKRFQYRNQHLLQYRVRINKVKK